MTRFYEIAYKITVVWASGIRENRKDWMIVKADSIAKAKENAMNIILSMESGKECTAKILNVKESCRNLI